MDITKQTGILKKKKTRFFETYISKVLKNISEDNGITANSKQQLNSVICLVAKLISQNVIELTEIAKKKTMSEKEVYNAVQLTLPQLLTDNAIKYSVKATQNFNEDNENKGTSRQEKAGIIFPPAQTEKFLRNFGYSKVMVTSLAPVVLASILEYLTSEILLNASFSAKENKRVRITIRDLEIGVRNNQELNSFFVRNNIQFLGGGVKPFIHETLLIKKAKKKKTKKSDEETDGEKKKHRFRPGTVSLREIRRFQKMSNCLTFAKFPFEKLVRQIVIDNTTDENMKISKDVFIILQYFIEQKIVELLKNANFAAIHAGRVKLMPIDIEFVNSILSGAPNPHQKEITTDKMNEFEEVDSENEKSKESNKDKDEDEDEEFIEEELATI